MIRLLAIGRDAAHIRTRLRAFAIDVDVQILPAAAIRAMEATPPDIVILYSQKTYPSIELLVESIQERPLARLTPLLILAQKQEGVLDDLCWRPPDLAADSLIDLISEHLGVKPADFAKIDSGPIVQPYRIEEVAKGAELLPESLSAEEIRRMLRKVRHEDYFTILDIPRSASNEHIQRAYHQLARLFDISKVDFDLGRVFREELAEISDAIEDAWAVLGDQALRATYLENTTRL